jgi:hypothetical protein
MTELHDYQRCDRWAWKTRCPAEAFVFENNGKQWCWNHTPELDPDHLRAIHTLQTAGLIPRTL